MLVVHDLQWNILIHQSGIFVVLPLTKLSWKGCAMVIPILWCPAIAPTADYFFEFALRLQEKCKVGWIILSGSNQSSSEIISACDDMTIWIMASKNFMFMKKFKWGESLFVLWNSACCELSVMSVSNAWHLLSKLLSNAFISENRSFLLWRH